MNDAGTLQLDSLLAETPALLAYARARLNDHHEVEELVQDCLIAAWSQRDNFAGRSGLRTWLIGILRHKLLDRLRAMRRRPDHPQSSVTAPGGADESDEQSPLDAFFTRQGTWSVDPTHAMNPLRDCPRQSAVRSELRSLIRLCMKALPARLRTLFSLRELDQLDTREAAQLAGVADSSASVLLSRTRLMLRECLQRRLSS